MGYNIAVLVYATNLNTLDLRQPSGDENASRAIIKRLFPRTCMLEHQPTDLLEGGFPRRRGVNNVGSFRGSDLIATLDAHLYNPSKLQRRYLRIAEAGSLVLLTQRSVLDMFAFGHWESGELVRSISINPVGGVWENIGEPEEFELPYWRGDHPMWDDYPLPFHPLDMGEAALRSVLGLVAEGKPNPALVSVEDVALKSWERAAP